MTFILILYFLIATYLSLPYFAQFAARFGISVYNALWAIPLSLLFHGAAIYFTFKHSIDFPSIKSILCGAILAYIWSYRGKMRSEMLISRCITAFEQKTAFEVFHWFNTLSIYILVILAFPLKYVLVVPIFQLIHGAFFHFLFYRKRSSHQS